MSLVSTKRLHNHWWFLRMHHMPDQHAVQVSRTIRAALPAGELRLEGVGVPLPDAAATMLREILSALARGSGVTLSFDDEQNRGKSEELLYRLLVRQNKIIEG